MTFLAYESNMLSYKKSTWQNHDFDPKKEAEYSAKPLWNKGGKHVNGIYTKMYMAHQYMILFERSTELDALWLGER